MVLFSRITKCPSKFSWILCAFFTMCGCTCNMSKGIVHYLKWCWTKHLCLMCQNCLGMQSALVAVQRMNGKVCLPQWGNGHFQVSNAILFMFIWFSNHYKPIFYQWNLGSWKFVDGQLIDYENNKNCILRKFVHVYLHLWKLHNICAVDRYFHEIISGLELLYCKL